MTPSLFFVEIKRINIKNYQKELIALPNVFIVILALFLSGCAGYVGGDLENINMQSDIKYCRSEPTSYVIQVTSDAKDDYADQNFAGNISTWTLGIIPTYWLSFVTSDTKVTHDGEEFYSRQDSSRIHKFYGLLWLILPETEDSLSADEGSGLRVESGIERRAISKTLNELAVDIKLEDICISSS